LIYSIHFTNQVTPYLVQKTLHKKRLRKHFSIPELYVYRSMLNTESSNFLNDDVTVWASSWSMTHAHSLSGWSIPMFYFLFLLHLSVLFLARTFLLLSLFLAPRLHPSRFAPPVSGTTSSFAQICSLYLLFAHSSQTACLPSENALRQIEARTRFTPSGW
jgi:hypothetical protein